MKKRELLLAQPEPGRLRVVDPSDIFLVEAQGGDSLIRLASKQTLVDRRTIGQLEDLSRELGFLRIHRSYLVNPERIYELRRREKGEAWEVVMEPPVNLVLPVAPSRWAEVRAAFL